MTTEQIRFEQVPGTKPESFSSIPRNIAEREVNENEQGLAVSEKNSANIELFLKGKDGLSALYEVASKSTETYIATVKEAIEKAISMFSSDRQVEATTITNTVLDLMKLVEKLNPSYEAVFNGNKEVFELLKRNLGLADLYKTKFN
jgi:hypothetical protein